ncbi:hypothetical protein HMPREF0379_0199 [[Eubacterium] yurii subsp. margaretiae ATCC 43715]|nr:hypothetical protein HMPREF0379_0199 [[Eubacterium] yurii subsp. margaretiae ATCC 43715]
MGIAALVVGIASLVLFVFFGGVFNWMVLPISIVGIILGALARKDPETKTMGTVGLICSIITLVLTVLTYIACLACFSGIAGGINTFFK